MPPSPLRTVLLILAAALLLATAASASSRDRFQSSRNIQVEPGDNPADVTCLFCSVYVRGEVAGDVTALGGSVIVEEGGIIHGDVASILGDVRLDGNGRVGGDVAAVGGHVRRDSQSVVGGDVASLGGPGWVLLIFVVPLAFLAGVIAGFVWLVRRGRHPVPAPA